MLVMSSQTQLLEDGAILYTKWNSVNSISLSGHSHQSSLPVVMETYCKSAYMLTLKTYLFQLGLLPSHYIYLYCVTIWLFHLYFMVISSILQGHTIILHLLHFRHPASWSLKLSLCGYRSCLWWLKTVEHLRNPVLNCHSTLCVLGSHKQFLKPPSLKWDK